MLPPPDPTAGMGARAAWAYLVRHPGFGLRCHGLHVYMPAPGIVEVSHAGTNDSEDMDQPGFLDRFSGATFYPISTSDVA